MGVAERNALQITRSGMRGSENRIRHAARFWVKGWLRSQAKGRVQAAAGRRARTVARMLMHNTRQRPQPSENFLTRRRGNLPTSKTAWYKRSRSLPQRARSWPTSSWQATCHNYWKPASGWKKLKIKWNDFMRVGRN